MSYFCNLWLHVFCMLPLCCASVTYTTEPFTLLTILSKEMRCALAELKWGCFCSWDVVTLRWCSQTLIVWSIISCLGRYTLWPELGKLDLREPTMPCSGHGTHVLLETQLSEPGSGSQGNSQCLRYGQWHFQYLYWTCTNFLYCTESVIAYTSNTD